MPSFAQQVGARSLVVRSRLGDQNAMAVINQVALQAQAGNVYAREGYAAIQDYIAKHPFQDDAATFGAEQIQPLGVLKGHVQADSDPIEILPAIIASAESGDEASSVAVVILADGPPLTDERVCRIAAALDTPEFREMFFMGAMQPEHADAYLESSPSPVTETLIDTGLIVHKAKTLQNDRLPNTPVDGLDDELEGGGDIGVWTSETHNLVTEPIFKKGGMTVALLAIGSLLTFGFYKGVKRYETTAYKKSGDEFEELFGERSKILDNHR